MDYRLSNSGFASKAFCIFNPSEGFKWSYGAVYVGRSGIYSMPVFIGADSALNQHVCAIGMSGSGKTFLLKNLVGRHAASGKQVIIVDWNSEYSGVVSYFYGTEVRISRIDEIPRALHGADSPLQGSNIISINLSALRNEAEKPMAARSVLKAVLEEFGDVPMWGRTGKVLILDEAWKVLKGSELSVLFREGRKYGIGIIIASQTASDISSEIIANCATIVIFRLQSADDFSLLLNTHIIDPGSAAALARMRRGSCIITTASAKDRPRQAVHVPAVEGSGYSICSIIGEKMEINLPMESLMASLAKIINKAEARQSIESYINQNGGRIELEGIINKLIEIGIGRSDIVVCLRSLGIPDTAIIDSYAHCR